VRTPFIVDLGRPMRLIKVSEGLLQQQIAERSRIQHIGIEERDSRNHAS
jgi:hypothetical protein